jgi:DNA-binding MarR family transcriptional regulator
MAPRRYASKQAGSEMGRFSNLPRRTYRHSQDTKLDRASPPLRAELAEAARELLRKRQRRVRLFGKAMFREPAWEMLVFLYAEQDQQPFTIASLSSHSGAPATTALRWIDYLEKRRLVRRQAHPTDARAVYVELTDEAQHSLDLYFGETLAGGR